MLALGPLVLNVSNIIFYSSNILHNSKKYFY